MRWRTLVVPFLVYTAVTVVLTWPLASMMSTGFVGKGGRPAHDVLLVLWILRWGVHALATQPGAFFDGNALHPTQHMLTTTEHLLGLQPLFAPAWLVSDNPVLALNAASIASFVLAGLGMHVLVVRWTGNQAAAYASGFAFAFAPWRLAYLGALHLLHVQYFPLIALGVGAILGGARVPVALATGTVIALQCLCSYYIGYMVPVLVAAAVLGDVAARGWHGRQREFASLALALATALAIVVPISLPYVWSGAAGNLTFEHKEFFMGVQAAAASPPALARTTLGVEVSMVALLALPLLVTLRRRDRERFGRMLGLVVTAGLAFVITGGPDAPGGVIYRALSTVVPGFDRMRSPSRFAFLLNFALAALAGLSIASIAAGRGARRIVAMTLAAAMIASPLRVWATAGRLEPWHVPTGEAIPAVYRWLARHGEGAPVLDVVREGATEGSDAALAMYYSTYHWLPIVVGFTGFYPPYYYAFMRPLMNQLPQAEALSLVVRCTGVRWVVLPTPPGSRRAAWSKTPGVRLRDDFGTHVLFEIEHPAIDACPARLFSRETTVEGTPLDGPVELSGKISVSGIPAELAARDESPVSIALHNTSGTPWPCTGALSYGRVELQMQWMFPEARTPEPPQRLLVPRDVGPDETVTFGAWLVHPRSVGMHHLRIAVRQGDAPDGPALVWETDVRIVGAPPPHRGATTKSTSRTSPATTTGRALTGVARYCLADELSSRTRYDRGGRSSKR